MDTSPSAQQIIDRIEDLERRNRILKLWGAFLVVAMLSGFAAIEWQLKKSLVRFSNIQAKSVFTHQLVLDSESGKPGALLAPGLFFLDGSGGRPLFQLNEAPGGPSFAMWGPDGKIRLQLDAGDSGSSISMGDQIQIYEDNKLDASFLRIGREERESKVSISVFARGGASINVADSSGFQSNLGTTSLTSPHSGENSTTSAATLTLFGKDGRVLWITPKP